MKINKTMKIIAGFIIIGSAISFYLLSIQNSCPDGKIRTYNTCSCKYVCQSPNLIGGVCWDSVCASNNNK